MKIFVLLSGAIFLGLVQCAKLDGSEPVACTTPDGKPGYCVNIRSCRQISNLLRPPTSEKTKEFVRNSACKGPHKYSVCCRSTPASEDDDIFDSRTREGNLYCEPYMTAHPPDPSTGCCGTSATLGNKIVGSDGEGTGIDQYPWTVLIEYESGTGHEICGGVLISGRYALTAAHCVTGAILRRAIPKFVRLGEYNITNQGPDCKLAEGGGQDCTDGVTRVPIEKIIPHPNYSFSANDKRNDIALIKLKELAPYSDFIRPICLPTKDINLSSNRNDYFTMIVVGWGATETKKYSDVKLEVKVPYVPLEQCRAYYDKFKLFQLGKGQLCAGGQNGLNNCKGDSGGPLMFKNGNLFELAGIVSFGKTDCKQGVPGVYTDIYAYKDWIMSILQTPEPQTT